MQNTIGTNRIVSRQLTFQERYSSSIPMQLEHGPCSHFLHHKTKIQICQNKNKRLWRENQLVPIYTQSISEPIIISFGYQMFPFGNPPRYSSEKQCRIIIRNCQPSLILAGLSLYRAIASLCMRHLLLLV